MKLLSQAPRQITALDTRSGSPDIDLAGVYRLFAKRTATGISLTIGHAGTGDANPRCDSCANCPGAARRDGLCAGFRAGRPNRPGIARDGLTYRALS